MPVGQENGLLHVVRHEQHRAAVSSQMRSSSCLHVVAGLRVERAERFVHQQDLRAHRERAGDGHALLHAARERVRVGVLEARQAHGFDQVADDLAPLRLRRALDPQAVLDVLAPP